MRLAGFGGSRRVLSAWVFFWGSLYFGNTVGRTNCYCACANCRDRSLRGPRRTMTIRRYLLSTVSALAVSGAASAADLPLKAPPPAAAVVSWTGFYLGAHGGVAWLDASQTVTGPINIATC